MGARPFGGEARSGRKDPYTACGSHRYGLDHYRENCVMCHGAPGVAAGELSKGSIHTPVAAKEDDMSDGELSGRQARDSDDAHASVRSDAHRRRDLENCRRHPPSTDLSQQERTRCAPAGEEEHHH